ncbi:MAG: hypothetical protein ABJH52_09565 [Henriciella sp.]
MSFWEQNTVILGLGSVIGGALYFGIIAWMSVAAGHLVAPNLLVWLGYMVVQIGLSIVGGILNGRRLKEEIASVPKGEDERDRLVRMKAEGMQGHVMSGLIFVSMAAWFIHSDAAILFHSLVAALILSELARAGWQMFNYNRAY